MKIKVDNAIIMAAGTSSRFAPISYEKPKALIEVNGQILIERQIEQLQEVGIYEIIIVVGYKKELFEYLIDKYNAIIVDNIYYKSRNNNASIFVARNYLKNSYICSADNYFVNNPFNQYEEFPFYSAVFENGPTKEWCIKEDVDGYINEVVVGGFDQWVMLGHVFWDKQFSDNFSKILDNVFDLSRTRNLFWENIYAENLDLLKLKIKKWEKGVIQEFDTLDELRKFDKSYINNSRSLIIKSITKILNCGEKDINDCSPLYNDTNEAIGFTFKAKNITYKYTYSTKLLEEY